MSGSSIISDTGEYDGDAACQYGKNFKWPSDGSLSETPRCGEPAAAERNGPSHRIGGVLLCEAHAADYDEVFDE